MVAAVGICAEALRRSHARQAAEQGANTYLTSHFGIPSDLELRHTVMRSHAEQHGMAVAFANYAGHTGGLRASGGSAIFGPTGEVIVQLGPDVSGVAIAIERETGWQFKAVLLDGE
jgi:5-aminopentanamidase